MESSAVRDVIFTPPPTPNGGLHVGHVAGPYLRADLNTKLRKLLGVGAAHVSHIDNYQTYVAKKAAELGRETETFRQDMIRSINDDFQSFDISFDLRIDNTADPYRRFLTQSLAELFRDSRVVSRLEFIGADERYSATEAFISGTCPGCLQRAFANVCENCGRPLAVDQMIHPIEEATGITRFSESDISGTPNAIFINLDDIQWIRNQHRAMAIDNRFITSLINTLGEHSVTLTLRSGYGFSVGNGRVINPWIEIFFAHMYSLGQLLGVKSECTLQDVRQVLHINRDVRVSYYFGVDNSYYYSVLFPLLTKIMDIPRAIPVALKANRFLTLNNKKMSSSKNNVIWARDIAGTLPISTLRAVLVASCPEYTEINFNKDLLVNRPTQTMPTQHTQGSFDNPSSDVGKRFRSILIELSDPRNFSTEDLLNRISKVNEFLGSERSTPAETVELSEMITYLSSHLAI